MAEVQAQGCHAVARKLAVGEGTWNIRSVGDYGRWEGRYLSRFADQHPAANHERLGRPVSKISSARSPAYIHLFEDKGSIEARPLNLILSLTYVGHTPLLLQQLTFPIPLITAKDRPINQDIQFINKNPCASIGSTAD